MAMSVKKAKKNIKNAKAKKVKKKPKSGIELLNTMSAKGAALFHKEHKVMNQEAYLLNWKSVYGNAPKTIKNPFNADFENEAESANFYKLTPHKIRMFERCATRMADIYEKILRDSKDAEVARLTRLVGKLRGNTFG